MRLLRQCDDVARNFKLSGARAAGEVFNAMAVTVARRKVHLRISLGRIVVENRFDETDAFDQAGPVKRREQFHARDDVADGHLRGGLPVMFELNDLLDALFLALHAAFDPFDERRYVGVLIAQPLRQLHDVSTARQRLVFELANQFGDHLPLLLIAGGQ